MKKLNITHINTQDFWGGAAKVSWKLAEIQRENGYLSQILCGKKMTDSHFAKKFDIKRNESLKDSYRNQGLLYYDLEGSHELYRDKFVTSADVLHLHNLHGDYFNPFSMTKLSEDKPIVWTLHDMQSFTGHCAHSFECNRWKDKCGSCPDLNIYPAIVKDSTEHLLSDKKKIYNNSNFEVVVPSKWLKEKVEQSILKDKNVHLIYNGIDDKIFYPRDKKDVRQKHNLPQDAIILALSATGGITNPWKGYEYLKRLIVDLSIKYPNLYFLNIGSLKKSLNVKNIIDIEYTQDENKIAELYCAADIYVYPSLADNCPLTILEVMACGIPIVSFKTGGIPELVIDNVNGLLVEYKNYNDFLSSTEKMINSEKLRKEFSENALRIFSEKFTLEKMYEEYNKVYEKALENYKKPTVNINMPSSKKLLIYVDPGYRENFGHYLQMSTVLKEELAKNKIDVIHLTSINVSEEIVNKEKLTPIFNHIAIINDKIPNYLGILDDFEKKLYLLKENIKSQLQGYDITMYMYTAHPLHFPIFAKVFGDTNYKILLNLFYIDYEYCNGITNNYYDYLIRKAYEEYNHYNKNGNVKIVYESERASDFFNGIFGKKEIVDAQPIAKIPEIKPRTNNNKVTLGYIGYTSEKSGYHLVYHAYSLLSKTTLKDMFLFKVKHNKRHYTKETLAMYEYLNSQTHGIENINHFLPTDEYNDFINSCDVILLPYSKTYYPIQTSGVLTEAIFAKKIVIAPTDTWMGDIVEKYKFGITFQSDNVESFVNSVAEILVKFNNYKLIFDENYNKFLSHHSPRTLLEQLGLLDVVAVQKNEVTEEKQKKIICPVCSESEVQFVRYLKGQRTNNEIKLYSCPVCQSLCNPSGYREDEHTLKEDMKWHVDKIERNMNSGVVLLKELLKFKPDAKSILDIGAGVGSLMLAAKKFGLSPDGVELNKYAVDYAKANFSLDIKADYYKSGMFNKKFDIITIVMVLEHLDNPASLFKEALKDLNRGGILYVSVPFYNPEVHQKYLVEPDSKGTLFFDNDVHITHFTDKGFIKMAQNAGCTYIEKLSAYWTGFVVKVD